MNDNHIEPNTGDAAERGEPRLRSPHQIITDALDRILAMTLHQLPEAEAKRLIDTTLENRAALLKGAPDTGQLVPAMDMRLRVVPLGRPSVWAASAYMVVIDRVFYRSVGEHLRDNATELAEQLGARGVLVFDENLDIELGPSNE